MTSPFLPLDRTVIAREAAKMFLEIGAVLFYCSDALIAWRRFVRPKPWQPLVIIVTYHLAQAGLVLSLAT